VGVAEAVSAGDGPAVSVAVGDGEVESVVPAGGWVGEEDFLQATGANKARESITIIENRRMGILLIRGRVAGITRPKICFFSGFSSIQNT
jgi:hypothetical protein